MVPADSRRIPRVLRYSGGGSPRLRVSPTGLSPAVAGVPTPFGYALPALPCRSYYPGGRVATPPVWAPPLSLAATGGIICLFSFPAGTEMFQFPALAPLQVVSLRTGSPIRTPADHAVFAGPRGFSQLVTSFFASGSLRHPPCALSCFPFSLLHHARMSNPARGSVVFYSFRSICLLSRVHHVNDLPSFSWRITDSNR